MLSAQIASLNLRISATSVHGQELDALKRDYDASDTEYHGLLKKQLSAQLRETLEKRHQDERLRLLEGADLPRKPIRPNRNDRDLSGLFSALLPHLRCLLGFISPTRRSRSRQNFKANTESQWSRQFLQIKVPSDHRASVVPRGFCIVGRDVSYRSSQFGPSETWCFETVAIYEAYYHCRREPFSLSPDPSFLYAAEPHREALAQLRYLVQERKGFAVVTGEVGTGKTMLLRSLIESVGPRVQTGYVFNPPRTIGALYDSIGYELGIALNGEANPAAVLNRHLLSVYENGGTVVMIFDEAQSLTIQLLEEIRLLTNIETSSTKLAQVVLAGQPEFDAMIDSTELRALRQTAGLSVLADSA